MKHFDFSKRIQCKFRKHGVRLNCQFRLQGQPVFNTEYSMDDIDEAQMASALLIALRTQCPSDPTDLDALLKLPHGDRMQPSFESF